MNGGSSASHLAASPCFVLSLHRSGNRRGLDYQGRAGIMSLVQRNLRPVIFGVDSSLQVHAKGVVLCEKTCFYL